MSVNLESDTISTKKSADQLLQAHTVRDGNIYSYGFEVQAIRARDLERIVSTRAHEAAETMLLDTKNKPYLKVGLAFAVKIR